MYEVLPKYIQCTRRWMDDGSGMGRKSIGWSGEHGMRRGRRFSGTENCPDGLGRDGASERAALLIRSSEEAPLNSPRRKVECPDR
jgi:hypothetical protein